MTVEQKPDRLVQKLYKPTSSTRRRSSGFISMLTYFSGGSISNALTATSANCTH